MVGENILSIVNGIGIMVAPFLYASSFAFWCFVGKEHDYVILKTMVAVAVILVVGLILAPLESKKVIAAGCIAWSILSFLLGYFGHALEDAFSCDEPEPMSFDNEPLSRVELFIMAGIVLIVLSIFQYSDLQSHLRYR